MANISWTDEELTTLKKALDSGATASEAAQILKRECGLKNYTRNMIIGKASREGIKLRSGRIGRAGVPMRVQPDERDAIIALALRGQSLRQIAHQVRPSESAISRVIRQARADGLDIAKNLSAPPRKTPAVASAERKAADAARSAVGGSFVRQNDDTRFYELVSAVRTIDRPAVDILALERHHCRAPMADGFCGDKVQRGSYCAAHHALFYNQEAEQTE